MFADTFSREQMVRELIEARGVRDPRVLAAMREVPRHLFVRTHLRSQAYGDHALPIGDAQTISQPYIVARMSELLEVDAGPQGARDRHRAPATRRRSSPAWRAGSTASSASPSSPTRRFDGCASSRSCNVKIQAFDGTVGWSDVAPFDRILVTAGAPTVPKPLLDQLAPKGKLLVPEGGRGGQQLVLYERLARGVRRRELEAVAFVPLVGRFGWRDPARSPTPR